MSSGFPSNHPSAADEEPPGSAGWQPGESRNSFGQTAFYCLLLALGVAALVTCRFAPRFSYWPALLLIDELPTGMAEFERADLTLRQVDNPWAPVDHPIHKVIAWRLLFPVVWHYLHLPRGWLLAVPQIGCLLALWLAAWLTYERLGRWGTTFVATALFAALPWFFVSSGWLAHFDSWIVLAQLIVAFVPSRTLLGVTCLLTPWIDVRLVIALPVTLAVRALALRKINEQGWTEMLRDLAVVVVVSIPYPLVRVLALAVRGDADSSHYVQSHWAELQTVPWSQFAAGLWSGYRAGWIVVIAALVLCTLRAGWRWGGVLAAAVVSSALGSLVIAWDMSRSLMIISPVFLLGMWLWEEWRPHKWRWALPAVLVVHLLLPAKHVLWSIDWYVEWLPREIERWHDPPHMFTAAKILRQARAAKERGDLAQARALFDLSVATEPHYCQAHLERAVLRMDGFDLAGAEADVNEAIRLHPNYPNALWVRAVLRGARGAKELAIADLRQALELAPPGWERQEAAQQLIEQLLAPAPAPPPE